MSVVYKSYGEFCEKHLFNVELPPSYDPDPFVADGWFTDPVQSTSYSQMVTSSRTINQLIDIYYLEVPVRISDNLDILLIKHLLENHLLKEVVNYHLNDVVRKYVIAASEYHAAITDAAIKLLRRSPSTRADYIKARQRDSGGIALLCTLFDSTDGKNIYDVPGMSQLPDLVAIMGGSTNSVSNNTPLTNREVVPDLVGGYLANYQQ